MLARRSFLLGLLSLSGPLSGCAFMRSLTGRPVMPPPPVFSDDAPLEEIVAHLNANIEKVKSWRTTNATISSRGAAGFPVSVRATIAVEAPRNFRLVAHNGFGGNEADLGSNDDQFWFWNKRNEEKCVFLARHDQPAERMQRFPIPFQPDWIMEVMGVIPIDAGELRIVRGPPGSHTVTLLADRRSPQGLPVRKATLVDLQNGVIREQGLYDARSKLIARATLSEYVRSGRYTAVPSDAPMYARKIKLEWSQAQLELEMHLSDVEINPPRIDSQTWALPEFDGYTVWDLSR